jgi:hypothetical protein
MTETTGPKYPEVVVDLGDCDGNAYSIIGRCIRTARRAGLNDEQIRPFVDQARSGTYDEMFRACMEYFEITYGKDSCDDADN